MALNFPNSPSDGQIYIDGSSGNRWVWDTANTCWKSTSTFTQTITVSTTSPGTPVVGQLWWNKDYGRLLVYYNDGDSNQWVEASPADGYGILAFGVANAAFNTANSALANTSGVVFNGNLNISGNVKVANTLVISNVTSISTVSTQIVDTFDKRSYRTAKYLIQGTNDSDIHSSEILLIHNDIDAFTVEYGTIYSTAELYTVSANISVNTVNLIVATNYANTIVDYYKTQMITRSFAPTSSGDMMTLSGTEDLGTGSGSEDLNT